MVEISPSILSADFARLADGLAAIERGGADWVHVDVMDGHFVPNLTIGPPVVEALKRNTRLPLDVHLMIENADRWAVRYVEAGASLVAVHAEACPHLHRTLGAIRAAGARCGVALNPATPLEAIDEVLEDVDLVLVMSVNPGFSGQSFIPHAVDKVRRLAARLAARGAKATIEVDGGVGTKNIATLVEAGARMFVAGNAVFAAPDPSAAVGALRTAGEAGLR